MARAPSVTRRLMLTVTLSLVLFFALTGVGLDYLFRELVERSVADLLEQELVSLVGAAESTSGGRIDVHISDPDSRLAMPRSGHYAEISTARGEPLWSSPSLAGLNLRLSAPMVIGARETSVMTFADGATVRVLRRGLRWDEPAGRSRDLVFSVAESTAPYDAQLRRFRQVTGLWFTLLTIVMIAALGWLMRRALRPIRRLEAEIGAVEAGQLERLSEGYPRELAGTADNLNKLLLSERRRITRYRDTLGNLAHQLKTPLAVMRQALRSDASPQVGIDHEIDRMTAIIDRQLTRGAATGAVTLGQSAVAVMPLAAELRASLLRVHADKDLSIELQSPPDVGFVGEAADLIEMLGNLLDNSCKWCRERVRLRAALSPAIRGAVVLHLWVEDDGPGVAPADREWVLARGARADEQVQGHGLGLAIVRDSVAAYNGGLAIGSSAELGGASVHLTLPGREMES
jgi:two-component system sensor histidine kinase PhoQ